jgi:hypothetical protein
MEKLIMRPSSTLKRLALAAAVGGAAITATPALANAASTCTFSHDSLPARVDIFDGSGTARLAIERSGSTIMIADVGGPLKPCPGPTGNATVFNTDQIVVHGNASATFDEFSTHTLAPGKTPEPDGNSEIETLIFNAAPTNLTVFGTVAPDTMRVASGGGVMLGSDLDVDVRARSATHVSLQGGFGSDYLSGRGGYPSSIPGPATTTVSMFGQEGDNILIDGPLSGDQLQGDDGNDTLFTHDFRSSDHSFGLGGFDQLTKDPGDTAGSDVDRINVVGVGRLRLAPTAVTAHAGKPARVELAWKHPKAWKQLRSLKLRASDAGEVLGSIRIDPARGRISGHGALYAARGSTVAHHGKWVTARLRLRPSKQFAGRTLRLAVQAMDVRAGRQLEPLAGSLTIER